MSYIIVSQSCLLYRLRYNVFDECTVRTLSRVRRKGIASVFPAQRLIIGLIENLYSPDWNPVRKKITKFTKTFRVDTTCEQYKTAMCIMYTMITLECGPMPNVMAALPNIGSALCSTPCTIRLPRRETRWNLQGYPKLPNRSQPLVGRSSPYYQDMWRRYWCLTFSPIVDTSLSCKDIARQNCAMVPKWRFLRPVFSESRLQHILDMHSKFTLRPYHVF